MTTTTIHPATDHPQTTATTATPEPRRTTLYFREGNSDKVYHVALEANGSPERFVVTFAFGRRGATLQTGTKTPEPVPYLKALGIFNTLVVSKLNKGYTPGENGTPYQHSDNEGRSTGIHPQLLNPVEDEHRLAELLLDPLYCCQEKKDGKRLLLRKRGKVIEGINRKGLIVSLPEPITAAAKALPFDLLLDGEAIGDTLHVFDLLDYAGGCQRHQPYAERLRLLSELLAGVPAALLLVPTAYTAKEKHHLLARLQREKREGVVLKNLTAPYTPGRHPGCGDALKFKFQESASFVVTQVHPTKRSVSLGLYDGSELLHAGNVTIPSNAAVPSVGSVVEVRYLYTFQQSGVLYQPVYLGPREDIEAAECVATQLKYRPEAEMHPTRS